ncbi:hypothetical protein F5148DRAFT_750336 [Russula earlei]|uniref:Uncharacterized protein n=1 Tax=Russula earlei TaxID=71964 RepID=A0ACC0UEL8_9AGAM|nr:hypothetical protein F5148DRAFT_750336 [Russula earlei]
MLPLRLAFSVLLSFFLSPLLLVPAAFTISLARLRTRYNMSLTQERAPGLRAMPSGRASTASNDMARMGASTNSSSLERPHGRVRCLEVVAVEEERVSFRLSPSLTLREFPGTTPSLRFSYFVTELRRRRRNLAHLHIIEPRIRGTDDRVLDPDSKESSNLLGAIWEGKAWISKELIWSAWSSTCLQKNIQTIITAKCSILVSCQSSR